MGIWDAVYSTADAVKQRLPDPSPVKSACRSAHGTIGSAVGWVSSKTPDLAAPVAGAVRWSCNRGLAAALAVDRTVRVEGVKRVKESVPVPVPDKEVLWKIGVVALGLTDLALEKYTPPFTGGIPAYKLVRETFVTKKDTAIIDQAKVKELQSRVERLERMTQGSSPQPQQYGPRSMVGVHHKPEDIVRIFMMKGFIGGDFIHDQVALKHSNWKRDALLIPVPCSI